MTENADSKPARRSGLTSFTLAPILRETKHRKQRRPEMFKRTATVFAALLVLAACSSSTPRIIQTPSGTQEVRLISGMATQIEMPDSQRVQSVVAGNPSLVTAEQTANVVNLVAKGGVGETNLIIRAADEDGHVKVYQYRVVVQDR
jgi:hypothetical protein